MKAVISISALLIAGLLPSCATTSTCDAIDSYQAASPSSLECAARAGNKAAQLELGIRYEEGRGVPRDLRRAERLYEQAARSSYRNRSIYSPPVGNERFGPIVPVGRTREMPGLPEARERLRRMQSLQSK